MLLVVERIIIVSDWLVDGWLRDQRVSQRKVVPVRLAVGRPGSPDRYAVAQNGAQIVEGRLGSVSWTIL